MLHTITVLRERYIRIVYIYMYMDNNNIPPVATDSVYRESLPIDNYIYYLIDVDTMIEVTKQQEINKQVLSLRQQVQQQGTVKIKPIDLFKGLTSFDNLSTITLIDGELTLKNRYNNSIRVSRILGFFKANIDILQINKMRYLSGNHLNNLTDTIKVYKTLQIHHHDNNKTNDNIQNLSYPITEDTHQDLHRLNGSKGC
jgi:disulfide oxidoreductase YuzD